MMLSILKSSVTNRNKIKAGNQELMLSVPLKNKENLINELVIHDERKNLRKHWASIETNYNKADNWDFIANQLKDIYFSWPEN